MHGGCDPPLRAESVDVVDAAFLLEWLDREVKARLVSLEERLDSFSARVGENQYGGMGPVPPAPQGVVSLNVFAKHDALDKPLHNTDLLDKKSHTTFIKSHITDLLEKKEQGVSKRLQAGWVRELWYFLHAPQSSTRGLCFIWVMRLLIGSSIIFPLSQAMKAPDFDACDIESGYVFDLLFLIEVLLRFAVAPSALIFFTSPYNVIDLAASVPPLAVRAALQLAPHVDGGAHIFLVCFVPGLRSLKLLRHFETIHLLFRAFQGALEALPVLFFTLGVIVLVFSAVIYCVEPRSNIATLGEAWWFTIITISTVGYGDISPVTDEGRFVVGVLAVCGTLYMSIPLGTMGSAFSNVWDDRDRLLLMERVRSRLVHSGFTKADLRDISNLFDENSYGALSLSEFRALIRSLKLGIREGRVIDLFNLFDEDRSGTIDHAEFIRCLFPRETSEIVAEFLSGTMGAAKAGLHTFSNVTPVSAWQSSDRG